MNVDEFGRINSFQYICIKFQAMSIEKEVIIKSIQEMPERFSWDELWDRLYLLKKVQIAMEQSKNEQGIAIEESQKRLEKQELLFKLEEGLQDVKNGNLVSLEEAKKRHSKWQGKKATSKKIPQFGSMKGLVVYMAPDFNEPLEDFKEYM